MKPAVSSLSARAPESDVTTCLLGLRSSGHTLSIDILV